MSTRDAAIIRLTTRPLSLNNKKKVVFPAAAIVKEEREDDVVDLLDDEDVVAVEQPAEGAPTAASTLGGMTAVSDVRVGEAAVATARKRRVVDSEDMEDASPEGEGILCLAGELWWGLYFALGMSTIIMCDAGVEGKAGGQAAAVKRPRRSLVVDEDDCDEEVRRTRACAEDGGVGVGRAVGGGTPTVMDIIAIASAAAAAAVGVDGSGSGDPCVSAEPEWLSEVKRGGIPPEAVAEEAVEAAASGRFLGTDMEEEECQGQDVEEEQEEQEEASDDTHENDDHCSHCHREDQPEKVRLDSWAEGRGVREKWLP